MNLGSAKPARNLPALATSQHPPSTDFILPPQPVFRRRGGYSTPVRKLLAGKLAEVIAMVSIRKTNANRAWICENIRDRFEARQSPVSNSQFLFDSAINSIPHLPIDGK